jgi:hypothetical protein
LSRRGPHLRDDRRGLGLRRTCRWRDFGAGATTMFDVDAVPVLERDAVRIRQAGSLATALS